MPLHGALLLSDLSGPKLSIYCRYCDLRRRYDRQALINKVGNVKVPQLLEALAKAEGCSRHPPKSWSERCGVLMGVSGDAPPPI